MSAGEHVHCLVPSFARGSAQEGGLPWIGISDRVGGLPARFNQERASCRLERRTCVRTPTDSGQRDHSDDTHGGQTDHPSEQE